jgi:hypothetical protein
LREVKDQLSIFNQLGGNHPSKWAKKGKHALAMAVLVGAALIMPVLAKEKRRLSVLAGSAALRADAAESALCA